MVGHIVMWKLKDTAEGRDKAENAKIMCQMLGALPGLIPQLRTLAVSADVFASAPDTDVVLYTVFATPEDLQAYQVHPEHKKCVAFVQALVAERRVVDYHFE